MPLGSLVRFGVSLTTRTVDVVTSLPRIAIALERLADSTDDLRRIAEAAPAVEALAGLATELRTLAADSARREDFYAARDTIRRLTEVTTTLRPLADSVTELNRAVASLNTTVSPLQGASERLGRLVDRLPASKQRRVVDVDPTIA